MNNKSSVNCYINIFKHPSDNGAYYELINEIVKDYLLTINMYDGKVCLCFRSYGVDIEDLSICQGRLKYRVIPFIFKYDKENKKFQDAITGTYFSFHTYDGNDERKFFEDKGELGEYIEDSLVISEEEAKNLRSTLSSVDVQTYRKALRKLESVIKKTYSSYYEIIGKQRRVRERKQNLNNSDFRSSNGINM